MRQTALTELIQFYKENQNKIAYDVFLHRLVDKIMNLQDKEREQIIDAYNQRAIDFHERILRTGEEYFDKTYL